MASAVAAARHRHMILRGVLMSPPPPPQSWPGLAQPWPPQPPPARVPTVVQVRRPAALRTRPYAHAIVCDGMARPVLVYAVGVGFVSASRGMPRASYAGRHETSGRVHSIQLAAGRAALRAACAAERGCNVPALLVCGGATTARAHTQTHLP